MAIKSKSPKKKNSKIIKRQVKSAKNTKNKKVDLKKRSVKKTIKTPKKKYQKNRKQFGGDETSNQIAIGTAFTVIYDRQPEKNDELLLKKNDIIYVINSPAGGWWFGISRNAIENALISKKKTEDVHEVIVELIDYLYKNPKYIKSSMFGILLGWFPVNYVTLYTPKKSVIKSLLNVFDKKTKLPIELTSETASILQTHELSPSPTSQFPPYVQRKLENIPKRNL